MPLNVSIKDSGDIMVEMMEAHLKSFMHSKIIKKNFLDYCYFSNHTIFYSD